MPYKNAMSQTQINRVVQHMCTVPLSGISQISNKLVTGIFSDLISVPLSIIPHHDFRFLLQTDQMANNNH